MRLTDAAWLSGTNLLKNPMRTLLTILGLGVGVAAVLTVLTLGTAGQMQVECEIDKLGVDKVWITAEQGSGNRLQPDSAARIARKLDVQSCGTASMVGSISMDETTLAVTVMGYDEFAENVRGMTLTAGRSFTQNEYEQGAAVTILDETLAEQLGSDVLGKRIALGSRLALVVGIMRPVAAQAIIGVAVLPLQTLMDTYMDAGVTEVTVSVPKSEKADTVAALALNVLGDGYQAATLQEEIDAARSVIRIFVMVLASVAAVCMVTGGVGVMNILLVSVRERRREIGLMKAVGGTSWQVAALFLMEACTYALLGGLLGLVLGMGMIAMFGRMIGLQASLAVSTAVFALGAAAILGALFGVLPAVKASAMLPVDALRQE